MDSLMCEFKHDERLTALQDRIDRYYSDCVFCDNNQAYVLWKEFKEWSAGYTSEEINAAKRNSRV